ncbi:CapA family protein [Nocardioides sp. Root140]|uniref:CapA family protein n=1 Tax=Nocardioides sp. Root140 TaxID=1736460 RepID=UPI0006F4319A|nr:CapA family protein [Nocardioides sp. Root140]KQY57263.1 hypothetical protein ASD30_13585 [Nocardioides sp. Root140]
MGRRVGRAAVGLIALALLATAGCETEPQIGGPDRPIELVDAPSVVTLAFAGDVHFPGHLAGLPGSDDSTLGPMSEQLAAADVAMVNLESAVLSGPGQRDTKELERRDSRYWFRTSPAAFDLLDRSGVDVVTMANNHGADYGRAGLLQTLRTAARAPVAVVGVGRDSRAAFTPHRVTVNGTPFAFFGADGTTREGANPVWEAGAATPGIAAARSDRPAQLLAAVRRASVRGDVVVVYLHWGTEYATCPDGRQQALATALSEAGADIVVGSHTHQLQGSGTLGGTYVAYGLGNFHWYNSGQPLTGVLTLRVEDGVVAGDDWGPASIPAEGGQPAPLGGGRASTAVSTWRTLRSCTGLSPLPGVDAGLPQYAATVQPIGPELRARLRSSHRAGCPVPLRDLRHLRIPYVGFDGRVHRGEMVVRADLADDVVGVFREVYAARWPIARMRLIDDYAGDDARSMAANNTSAFNCRLVAGQGTWSEHAYGAAIDLNPVQNPYVRRQGIEPASGRPFAAIDRSRGATVPAGAIRSGDPVHRAFTRIGWVWGGVWPEPDYQHFSAP